MISRDGFCEVRVERGTGYVDKLDRSGRNAQISIASSNRDLRELVTGWIDPTDLRIVVPLDDLIKGAPVAYTIETHRRANMPDKPLAELANRQKLREVVALEIVRETATAAGERSSPVPAGRRPESGPSPDGDVAVAGAGTSGPIPQAPGMSSPGRGPEPTDTTTTDQEPEPDSATGFGPAPDNPGYASTLLNMAAKLCTMAAASQPSHPLAPSLGDASRKLRIYAARIAGAAVPDAADGAERRTA